MVKTWSKPVMRKMPTIVQRVLTPVRCAARPGRSGLDPTDAVVVGDSAWDVHACHALKVPCVGLLTGGWSATELRDAGAVEVHDDLRALLAALDGSILAE